MEDRVSESLVAPGEWYAVYALPDCPVAADLPDVVDLGDGFVATRRLPVPLSRRWRGWLGTHQVERLEEANLFLMAKAVSVPKLTNQACEYSLRALYLGLLAGGPFDTGGKPLRLFGSRRRDTVEVISAGEIRQPRVSPGTPCDPVTLDRLRLAVRIEEGYARSTMRRSMWRFEAATQAFLDGISCWDPAVRLHQFVRCIEAFVFPAERATRERFVSRAELFVGPGHRGVMDELYRLRSWVEHLHNPLEKLGRADETEGRIRILLRTVQAEAIARYCLRNFLLSASLLRQFRDDDGGRDFWEKPDAERRRLWGAALDLDAVTASVESEGLGRIYIGM